MIPVDTTFWYFTTKEVILSPMYIFFQNFYIDRLFFKCNIMSVLTLCGSPCAAVFIKIMKLGIEEGELEWSDEKD